MARVIRGEWADVSVDAVLTTGRYELSLAHGAGFDDVRISRPPRAWPMSSATSSRWVRSTMRPRAVGGNQGEVNASMSISPQMLPLSLVYVRCVPVIVSVTVIRYSTSESPP